MKEKKLSNSKINILLLVLVVILSGLGLGFLNTATQSQSANQEYSSFMIVIKQLSFFGIGIVALVLGALINHNFYKRHIKLLVFLTIAFLLLTLIPGLGVDVYGARRWIKVGPLTFQPSEFAKLIVIFYLAAVLDNKKDDIRDFYKGVLPPLVLLILIGVFVLLENDFSTTMLIFFVGFILFFLSGVRLVTLLMLAVVGACGAVGMIFLAPYRIKRMEVLFNPWIDPFGSGWQSIQSMKCFSLGGFWGRGLGESTQKYSALPKGYNDYIFSVIVEESGVITGILMILIYFVIALLGINIAKRCKSRFSYLMAAGISSLMFVQAVLNVGVTAGIFPATGIPLPLVSAGGTSLVVFLFSIGVLINISNSSARCDLNEG
ncbi:MAG: putative lipid II flippase FtsW [Spirochaetales bacterium]|nr:putative lipid II flippase FtsW [Spirochaetales bacterium]